MAQTVRDVMTADVVTVDAGAVITDAASAMRERDVGDVLVTTDGRACGIVTDRDLVIRGIAERRNPDTTRVGDICSGELVSVAPTDPIDRAVKLMRDKAIRRVPVMEGNRPIGMVSIGDLAQDQDPGSALADISGSPPNR